MYQEWHQHKKILDQCWTIFKYITNNGDENYGRMGDLISKGLDFLDPMLLPLSGLTAGMWDVMSQKVNAVKHRG